VLEEGAHHKYLGHAKVPDEALAWLAVAVVDDVAAAAVAVVVAVAAAVVDDVVAVDVAVVAAAAAVVVAVVPVAVVEAREWASFVADHQMNYQTFQWTWETGEG